MASGVFVTWLLLAWIGTAQAEPAGGLGVASPDVRTSQDIEVFVRSDGAVYLGDAIVLLGDLTQAITMRAADRPDLRVVVLADSDARWAVVKEAVAMAKAAGVDVAMELPIEGAARPVDPLFPGDAAEALELGLTSEQEKLLKPRPGKLPQNPYGTTDFTAYTLEFGEMRIGLVDLTYGLVPRVQISTVPVLDAALVPNARIKGKVMDEGRVAIALSGSYYGLLLQQIGDSAIGRELGLSGTAEGEALFTARASIWGLSGVTSFRLTDSMSMHARLNYLNANASGQFDLSQVPVAIAPGLDLGETTLVPKVVGETVYFSLAVDQRFNRRDSLILRFRGPVFASARGILRGVDEESTASYDIIAAYRQWVSPLEYYAATIGWQFQWRHLEARVGLGYSFPQFLWLAQTVDIGYRFGGRTRVDERRVRRGYRDNLEELDDLGDAPPPPPPPIDDLPPPPIDDLPPPPVELPPE